MIDVNKVTKKKTTVIYLNFDDKRAGTNLIQRSGNPFAREHGVVPIEPVLTKRKL